MAPVHARRCLLQPGRRAPLQALIPGLRHEVAEVGTVRQRACRPGWVDRHGDLLSSKRPLSAHRAERRFARGFTERWASALSADRMRPLRETILIAGRSVSQK